MCDTLQDMRETAHTEGRSEGMHLFAVLIQKLTKLGRFEDISKAAADDHYRDQLIRELIGE